MKAGVRTNACPDRWLTRALVVLALCTDLSELTATAGAGPNIVFGRGSKSGGQPSAGWSLKLGDGVGIFDSCLAMADAMRSEGNGTGRVEDMRKQLGDRIHSFVQRNGNDAWTRVKSRIIRKTQNSLSAPCAQSGAEFVSWLHSLSTTLRPMALANVRAIRAARAAATADRVTRCDHCGATAEFGQSGKRHGRIAWVLRLCVSCKSADSVHALIPLSGRCVMCPRKLARQPLNITRLAAFGNMNTDGRPSNGSSLQGAGSIALLHEATCSRHAAATSNLSRASPVPPGRDVEPRMRCTNTSTEGTWTVGSPGDNISQGREAILRWRVRRRKGAPGATGVGKKHTGADKCNATAKSQKHGKRREACKAPEGCEKQVCIRVFGAQGGRKGGRKGGGVGGRGVREGEAPLCASDMVLMESP